ncbi:GNAT family N-acetyltransferase [Hymenobacter metallicola]|uniref:GNAT family N-acetyltransferase n=1 Tax=Hymenobacter metallicola TaxID=2563114 RepID=A0A4Z0QGX9_9BACT|nr:GNAT family N-acetyltransferase [Hymenobacter metallicola]TGE27932.1 GNAT family N-acetyltransferase [Hymenobacter metallicola]
MTLTWISKPFTDLTLRELHDALQLRAEVFIVEQNCAFQDIDGQDAAAHHLLGITPEGQLAAYARLFAAGQCYEQVSIGRVVVSPAFRRYGLGKELMRTAIAHCEQLFGAQPIKIGAQQYLTKFYQGFGFEQQGEMYLEDGIPHIYMLRA